MSETNQLKWVGIRPVNPEEDIPVKQSSPQTLQSAITNITDDTLFSINRPNKGDMRFTTTTATNAYIGVFTVPAGHEYHIVASCLTVVTSGSGVAQLYIRNNIPSKIFELGFAQRTPDGCFCNNAIIICPLTLPAGYNVIVYSSNTSISAHASIVYIDETL